MQKSTEKQTQAECLKLLRSRGIFCYRQNSGTFEGGNGGIYRMGANGAPDIIAVIRGKYVGIEVKSIKGGTWQESQRRFCENLTAAGGDYVLVRSLYDLVKYLDGGVSAKTITERNAPKQKPEKPTITIP